MFQVQFETDNDAFYNSDGSLNVSEVKRTVAEVLDKIPDDFAGTSMYGKVLDVNGNRIGNYSLVDYSRCYFKTHLESNHGN